MDFSPLFARDPNVYFLNAGTQSRAPLSVLRWMRERRDRAEVNPTQAMMETFPALWRVQQRLAEFLGACPHDLFLRPNITAAFNDFLFALPLPAGGEILANDHEYGAMTELARWRARRGEVSFRSFALPFGPDVSDDDFVRACVSALRPETKVFLLSHVATAVGTVLPVKAIAAELRRRGVIVLVDGAHAVGILPLDMRELADVDFYGGNFHKWFMGPAGTGFGWVNPRWREGLDWQFGGWASFTIPPFYGDFGDGVVETARRLMPGTIDPIPFLALGETLDFWRQYGPEDIRRTQARWRDLAGSLAESFGWERTCPRAGARLAGLVSFRRPPAWGAEVGHHLQLRIHRETGVQIALPQAGGRPVVRLSPGAYATEEEVRSGMEKLAQFGG
jgi:isopenicillin-N epimerase